jgi:tryptophan synthase alpha chain
VSSRELAPASIQAPRERIESALRASRPDGAPAMVAYLTAGFPTLSAFREHLTAIAQEADVIEVGVPFTDPMADGVTIQRASEQALRNGVTLEWILDELARIGPLRTPLLLMSYMNPLLSYGLERLAERAVSCGVCGFIVPDLPFDESAEFRAALEPHGLALVQMVTPVTEPDRLSTVAAASEGFLYAVTMTGTTGQQKSGTGPAAGYLERVRAASRVPVCAGFGIRSSEQVFALRGQVDGVIVGSALVEVIERGESPRAWLASLRKRD